MSQKPLGGHFEFLILAEPNIKTTGLTFVIKKQNCHFFNENEPLTIFRNFLRSLPLTLTNLYAKYIKNP